MKGFKAFYSADATLSDTDSRHKLVQNNPAFRFGKNLRQNHRLLILSRKSNL